MLHLALILALAVLFIHATTWEGMINAWVGRLLFDAPDWLKKPLFDCPICMAPWWGTITYLALIWFGDYPALPVMQVAVCLAMAGGINTLLIYLISIGKNGLPNPGGDY